jgi:hypothetical protein
VCLSSVCSSVLGCVRSTRVVAQVVDLYVAGLGRGGWRARAALTHVDALGGAGCCARSHGGQGPDVLLATQSRLAADT